MVLKGCVPLESCFAGTDMRFERNEDLLAGTDARLEPLLTVLVRGLE